MIQSGEDLQSGDELTSSSKEYVLRLNTDGTLLLYKGEDLLWTSGAKNIGSAPYKLSMQKDNHLILRNNDSVEVWATGVYIGRDGNAWEKGGYAILQDDGNFVVYDGNGIAMWDTQTYDGQKNVLDGHGKRRMLGL